MVALLHEKEWLNNYYPLSEGEKREVSEKYAQSLDAATQRVTAQVKRLNNQPELASIILDAINAVARRPL